MIILHDSFNGVKISAHRSVRAAVSARIAHSRRLSRNSPGSFLWYRITDSNGRPINHELIEEIELFLQNGGSR